MILCFLEKDGASSLEERWFWKKPNRAEASFVINRNNKSETLMNFFIPRDMTYFDGESLRLKDEFFIDYDHIKSIIDDSSLESAPSLWEQDGKSITSLFSWCDEHITENKIIEHQKILFSGWMKLISLWVNSWKGISVDIPTEDLFWWEKCLIEEALDYPALYALFKTRGVKAVSDDKSDFSTDFSGLYSTLKNHGVEIIPNYAPSFIAREWLKIATCYVGIICSASPSVDATLNLVSQLDKKTFPALCEGYQRWRKYGYSKRENI